jgi:hypothetical protein
MKRRHILLTSIAGVIPVAGTAIAAGRVPQVEVFKSPTCDCCGAWVDHLKAAGFAVQVREVADPALTRRRYGMPDRLAGCHTGIVQGYVLEGHVPAAEVKRLLAMKPTAIGLAVPGMPVGSPGMEVEDRIDPYQVLLVEKGGRETVFARYPKS